MIADSYFKTRDEADREARRRRQAPDLEGMITKVLPSAYGGYLVHSISAELMVDNMVDGLPPISPARISKQFGVL